MFESTIPSPNGMPTHHSLRASESLYRRLRFESESRFLCDSLFWRFGLPRNSPLRDVPLVIARIVVDLIESVRGRGGVGHLGRAYLDGLIAPVRLPQYPHYRSYWFDARRHALVGMVIGLDLIPHEGKYHVVEANLGAGISADRRQLYPTRLDPFITTMIELARDHGFERVVFCHNRWSPAYVDEFAAATATSGVEIVGASLRGTGSDSTRSMVGLPEPLEERTVYVIFPLVGMSMAHFLHNKLVFSRWMQATIEGNPQLAKKLAFIPTSDELIVPPEPADPQWPNLVIKLANRDKGKFVVMGRFRTEEEARDALRLSGSKALPGIFKFGLVDRLRERVFPRHETIYQQFIPPRLIDGRACKTRPLIFISPLVDQLLSAHATKSRITPPTDMRPGRVDDTGAYNVSHFGGGEYITVPAAEQHELREVAREFGNLAKIAIAAKFETGPAEI